MDKIYDYIILGAGPAGCFCALELVQKGYTVCILEKNKKNSRKVCGDGINSICTEVLEMMDFPTEKLIEAGAVPIEKYYIYRGGIAECINLAEKQKKVFGLPRNKTDLIFQEYVIENFNVPILYETYAQNIMFSQGSYSICGHKGKRLIIAIGSNSSVRINGDPCMRRDLNRPLGASMIVRGREAKEPFFLFDYDDLYHGTYAWIFCIGKGLYNVGLWLKEEKMNIREKMDQFMESRAAEWIGNDYVVEVPLKGNVIKLRK